MNVRFDFPVYSREVFEDVVIWSGKNGREWAAGVEWRF